MTQMNPRTEEAWYVRMECILHGDDHRRCAVEAQRERAPCRLDFDVRLKERLAIRIAPEVLEERRRPGRRLAPRQCRHVALELGGCIARVATHRRLRSQGVHGDAARAAAPRRARSNHHPTLVHSAMLDGDAEDAAAFGKGHPHSRNPGLVVRLVPDANALGDRSRWLERASPSCGVLSWQRPLPPPRVMIDRTSQAQIAIPALPPSMRLCTAHVERFGLQRRAALAARLYKSDGGGQVIDDEAHHHQMEHLLRQVKELKRALLGLHGRDKSSMRNSLARRAWQIGSALGWS